ncbi:hypothetical protein PR202_gb16146 [Eleusine coracana subsp. coracana]|uniref:Auxin-responsive protein n=1 Tax=Eleusine coracana subsp. coracana TaxID=191504 RepID=A0AAV5F162_ELECO|nr:hypothetical protein QOZ80_9BG0702370 [Eleusine coracana subsp. coracana]GJN28065.1 hypothetical protein PR202_gb16146 [Eleusine coracana subsp. coracana]
MDEMKSTNVPIEPEYEVKQELSVPKFVKVFMQGQLFGRKINMAPHNSYMSLSFTLKRLGSNFSMPSHELNGIVHNEEDGPLYDNNFIIFYDNMDGDRFFLGEVPWEAFVISVKRIYIVRVQENENEEDEGESPDANTATSGAPLDGDDAPGNNDDGDTMAAAASFDDGDAVNEAASADDWLPMSSQDISGNEHATIIGHTT